MFIRRLSAPAALPLTLLLTGCATGGDPAALTSSKVESVSLPNIERVYTEQRRGDWCWAACCEMALRYTGRSDVTQEGLVTAFRGDADDQTAIDWEVIEALANLSPKSSSAAASPTRVDIDANQFFSAAQKSLQIYLPKAADLAIADLKYRRPVLMGLKDWDGAPAHIVLVTSVDYRERPRSTSGVPIIGAAIDSVGRAFEDTFGSAAKYEIVRVTMYDPMPETGGVRTADAATLDAHWRFYLGPTLAKDVASQASQTVRYR